MSSSLLLLFAVLAFATASSVSESGKKAILDARVKAERELRIKLNGTDSSVLFAPIKALVELASTGWRDQDAIATFGNNDTVKAQLNSSVIFWKKKIEEAVKPYVTNPKAYKHMVVDLPTYPPNPTNNTKLYKEAEHNITEIVKNATIEFHKMYIVGVNLMKAKSVKEVTYSSFYTLELARVFKELHDFIINTAQWSKHDCAHGRIKDAIKTLKHEVETSKKEFHQAATVIINQYKSVIKK